MTERQVWLKMAKLCDSAEWDGDDMYIREADTYGLCGCLLHLNVPVTDAVYSAIKAKIIAKKPTADSYDGYKWGHSEKSMKQRADWCRKQAKALSAVSTCSRAGSARKRTTTATAGTKPTARNSSSRKSG